MLAFAFAALADALLSFARTPSLARSPALLSWVTLTSVGALGSVGAVVGVALEVLLRAASERPTLSALYRWCASGPSLWFAPEPALSRRLALASLTVLPAVALTFRAAHHAASAFHVELLAALASTLAIPLSLALTGSFALLVASPLDRALRRAGPAGSPGGVLALTLALALGLALRFVVSEWHVLHRLELAHALALGLTLALALALTAALRRRPRAVRPGVLALALAAFALALTASGLGLRTRQSVLTTVLLRSALTRYLVPPLQRALDRDRDGHGTLFGADDCDDRDPSRHPDAVDLPGNGVDENCSGADAPVRDLPDGVTLPPASPARPERAPSFVLLSIDSLRPDHVHAYGHPRATTDTLDRVAARGARFSRAYTVAPQSVRSFSATFTGRAPSTLVWSGLDPRAPALDEANTTLAERLHEAGWATGAFTNTSYFDGTPGFFQGFEVARRGAYFNSDEGETVALASAFLARNTHEGRPCFVWVHLMTPHEPYSDRASPRDFGHDTLARYDEDIAFADRALAPLVSAVDDLERGGVPVYLALFGDHGEAFEEHGWRYHSHDVHEEVLRVPLVLRGPGIAAGEYPPLVALYDLFPTVLALAGLPQGHPLPSRSLLPWVRPERPRPPPRTQPPPWRDALFVDVIPGGAVRVSAEAVVTLRWKLLHDRARHHWELYDLARDPGETLNLWDVRPAERATLRARLGDHDAPSGLYSLPQATP